MSEVFANSSNWDSPLSEELSTLLDLIGFARIIDRNKEDSLIRDPSSPLQFLYVIDTNILRLCFDPRGERVLTRPFRFLPQHETRDAAVAIITAEFLLTGALPRRRDAPLFVTPSHWREFTEVVPKMRDRLRDAKKHHKADEAKIIRKIEALQAKVQTSGNDPVKLHKLFNNDAQSIYSDERVDLFARQTRLTRLLLRGDLIRHVARAPFIDLEKIRISENDTRLEFWVNRLMAIHKRRGTLGRYDRNVKADAEALVQIEKLNEDLAARDVSVRLIFVTADRAILDATVRGDDPSLHSIARDVRQFIPLINDADIRGEHNLSPITKEIRLAIDALLTRSKKPSINSGIDNFNHGLDIGVRSFSQALAALARQHDFLGTDKRFTKALTKHLEDHIRLRVKDLVGSELDATRVKVAQKWAELIDHSRRSHADLISDYYRSLLGDLADAFNNVSDRTIRSMRALQTEEGTRLARELTCMHLESILHKDLALTDTIAGQWAHVPLGIGLAPLDVEDTPSATEKTVARIVRGVESGDWNEAFNQISNLCSISEGTTARLALSCSAVSMQLGRFSAARELADYSLELIDANQASENDVFRLTRARAIRIRAMSLRLAALLTIEEADDFLAERELEQSCIEASTVLKNLGRFAEAGLARAEAAAALATQIMLEELTSPDRSRSLNDFDSKLSRIASSAAAASDLANRSIAGFERDIMGHDLPPIVHKTGVWAAMWSIHTARLRGNSVPRLIRIFLRSVTGELDFVGNECDWTTTRDDLVAKLARTDPVNEPHIWSENLQRLKNLAEEHSLDGLPQLEAQDLIIARLTA